MGRIYREQKIVACCRGVPVARCIRHRELTIPIWLRHQIQVYVLECTSNALSIDRALASAVQLSKAEADRKLAANAMEEVRQSHTRWRHSENGKGSAAASVSVPEATGLRPTEIQQKLQAGLIKVYMCLTLAIDLSDSFQSLAIDFASALRLLHNVTIWEEGTGTMSDI